VIFCFVNFDFFLNLILKIFLLVGQVAFRLAKLTESRRENSYLVKFETRAR